MKKNLLWVGKEISIDYCRELEKFSGFHVQKLDLTVKRKKIELASTSKPIVLRLSSLSDCEGVLDFLELLKENLLDFPIVLIFDKSASSIVPKIINAKKMFAIYPSTIALIELGSVLESAWQEASNYMQKSLLLKNIHQQNRDLEILTDSLEKLVHERTANIAKSSEEQAEKLDKERQLIRFIKNLNQAQSHEDFLELIRTDVKKFHKISDTFLLKFADKNQMQLLAYLNRRYKLMSFDQAPKYEIKEQLVDAEWSGFLANKLGRPLLKLLSFPIINTFEKCSLVFETTMNELEVNDFSEYMTERVRAADLGIGSN